MIKLCRALWMTVIVAPLLAMPLMASAAPVVKSVSAHARPAQYRGECPAPLEFVGTIKLRHHPVVIEYAWERSNHTRSEVRRIQARSATQIITDAWGVGGPPGKMQVWEKLTILSPTQISSFKAKAEVHCQ